MKRLLALATLAFLAAPASDAFAIQKPFQIGFGGGVSVPVNDAGDALKSGWHGTGMIRFNLPGLPLGLRGAFNYSRFDLDSDALGFGGTGQILSGLGNVVYSLPLPMLPIKPYITAGIGAFHIKTNPDDASGVPDPDSETKFGINAGVGVQFGLMGLNGFVEGKLENVYTEQGFSSSVTDEFRTQVIPVTFGIFF